MNNSTRVALVTGANGTLGRSVVSSLEAAGMQVMRVDIGGSGAESFDVGSEDGCAAMVDRALQLYDRLDVLVLNAGVQHVAPIESFDAEDWARVLDVCLNGPFFAIKAAWPALTARPGGRVVATASTSSFHAEPYKVAYNAAKHGLLGLIKSTAVEGGPHGLTANAVAPSWMRTPMVEQQLADQMTLRDASREDVLAEFLGGQPVKRFIDTEEVAAAIAFLSSPAASAITGTCLPVDLGALA